MKNEKGFTLVELLTASWIAVMIVLAITPLISFEQKIVLQNRKQAEAKIIADAVFESAAKKLVMADAVILGTPDDSVLAVQDGWYNLCLDHQRYALFHFTQDVRLYACKESDCHLRLGVSVMEGDETLFEHSELLFLLNMNLRKEGIIEAVTNDEIFDECCEVDEIWYRKTDENEGREGLNE